MADAELERELTCAVCLEFYRHPLQLPCLHSFCRDCLSEILASQGGKKISCPDCRKTVDLGKQGLNNLQFNFKLASIVDYFRKVLEVSSQPPPQAPGPSLEPNAPPYESSPSPRNAGTTTSPDRFAHFRPEGMSEEEELRLVMEESRAEYLSLKSLREQLGVIQQQDGQNHHGQQQQQQQQQQQHYHQQQQQQQRPSSSGLYPILDPSFLAVPAVGHRPPPPPPPGAPQAVPEAELLQPLPPGFRRPKTAFLEKLSHMLRKEKKEKSPRETPVPHHEDSWNTASQTPVSVASTHGSLTQLKWVSLDSHPATNPAINPHVPAPQRPRPSSTEVTCGSSQQTARPASGTPTPFTISSGEALSRAGRSPQHGSAPLSHSQSVPNLIASRPLPPLPPESNAHPPPSSASTPPTPVTPTTPTLPVQPAQPVAPVTPVTPTEPRQPTFPVAPDAVPTGSTPSEQRIRPARRAPPPPPPKPSIRGPHPFLDPTPSITECKTVPSPPTVPKRIGHEDRGENPVPARAKGDNPQAKLDKPQGPPLPPRGNLPPLKE